MKQLRDFWYESRMQPLSLCCATEEMLCMPQSPLLRMPPLDVALLMTPTSVVAKRARKQLQFMQVCPSTPVISDFYKCCTFCGAVLLPATNKVGVPLLNAFQFCFKGTSLRGTHQRQGTGQGPIKNGDRPLNTHQLQEIDPSQSRGGYISSLAPQILKSFCRLTAKAVAPPLANIHLGVLAGTGIACHCIAQLRLVASALAQAEEARSVIG